MPMATSSRRAEAHLWLLLEEVLDELRSTDAPAVNALWGPRSRFRYVADALASAGVVPRRIATSIADELDDALAVRGLLRVTGFRGRPFPTDAWETFESGRPDAAQHWLESEIERHLDLVAAFDPSVEPRAGQEAIDILGAPARAFAAAEALPAGPLLLDELAASLAAAGYEASFAADAQPRAEWVRFLRDRPAPLTDQDRPSQTREVVRTLGRLRGMDVGVRAIGWSSEVIELDFVIRSTEGVDEPLHQPVLCRAVDDKGRLHLGQSGASTGGLVVRFRLRPGMRAETKTLAVRLSAGADRIEATLPL